jgi:hypothetical protein
MLDDRTERERDQKLEVLRLVVIEQVKLADWKGPLRTVNTIRRDHEDTQWTWAGWRDNEDAPWSAGCWLLYDVAYAQAKMGLETKALSLVKKYRDSLTKTYILRGTADGMLEKRKNVENFSSDNN